MAERRNPFQPLSDLAAHELVFLPMPLLAVWATIADRLAATADAKLTRNRLHLTTPA